MELGELKDCSYKPSKMTREEEIHKAAKEFAFSDKTETSDFYDVMNDFYYGAKWADKTMLEKACEYLKSLTYQEFAGGPIERTFSDEDIEGFCKAMER